MCVSRAGYYAWARRGASAHAQDDTALTAQIRVVHTRSRLTYGSPRTQAALAAAGRQVSRKRVARLMRQAGLRGRTRRRVHPRTTVVDPAAMPAPNRVRRQFATATTNRLWVGDVGAKAREEINLVEPGDNFGWSQMEGTNCFRKAGCDTTGLKMPLVQRAQSGGCNSITGGYVYRGSRRPDIQGAYIYGDYCHGYLRMLRYEDGAVTEHSELLDTGIRISSFGTDENGELYVVNHSGNVYWFARGGSATGTESDIPEAAALEQNFPNPFSGLRRSSILWSARRTST